MGRGRFGAGRMAAAVVMAAALSGLTACGTIDGGSQSAGPGQAGPAPVSGDLAERPTSLRREQLVGRWGVASFRDEKDRPRVEAQARAQCRLPYTITLGPTDGVMMHLADDSKLYELRLKGASNGKTYLGTESPPGDWQDREVVSLSEREFILSFVDPDARTRYGTVVYVRCA